MMQLSCSTLLESYLGKYNVPPPHPSPSLNKNIHEIASGKVSCKLLAWASFDSMVVLYGRLGILF
jgi:hypothetical protein